MRALVFSVFAVLAFGCTGETVAQPSPMDSFYFPTGIVHLDSPVEPDGLLYVASANFDKRFAGGSVMGLNLGKVGLPAFGAPVQGSPKQLPDLHAAQTGYVQISSFSGELVAQDLGAAGVRLWVPSRAEGRHLQAIDAPPLSAAGEDPTLRCFTPDGTSSSDCGTNAPTTMDDKYLLSTTGLPVAPAPYAVATALRTCLTADDCGGGNNTCESGTCFGPNWRDPSSHEPLSDVWVTALAQTDSPYRSGLNFQAFVVRVDSQNPTISAENFIDVGNGGTNSAVTVDGWALLSGRYGTAYTNLIRVVGRDGTVIPENLEASWRVTETRGLALSSDQSRLFLAGRGPDTLGVISVTKFPIGPPSLSVMRGVPLPAGANEIVVMPRPGLRDLVAISCVAAGAVVFYDDEVGDLVGQVFGVGLQPDSIAVDQKGTGARLYVTNFSDGRVAVIDVPDLVHPQDARLVAHLGGSQLCLTRGQCDGGT